jgi:glycosyltransferase involved in cell wall biosynthesis
MLKLTVITTRHPVDDTRIFARQALPLSQRGVEINLIGFIPGKGTEKKPDNLKIHLLKLPRRSIKPLRAFNRFFIVPLKAFIKALSIESDIYMFHDIDFLPWGLLLQLVSRKPVVFDAHELYFATFTELYLPSLSIRLFFKLYSTQELIILPHLAGVLTPSPLVNAYYSKLSPTTLPFISFPSIEEVQMPPPKFEEPRIAFISSLVRTRGADLIPLVMEKVVKEIPNTKLVVAGKAVDEAGENLLKKNYKWLEYKGLLPRAQVFELLRSCSVGWIFMRYSLNHSLAFALKLADYMAVGLPVVAPRELLYTSNLISETGCGLLVPKCEDIEGHARALTFLLSHPKEAKEMSDKGRQAILNGMNNENQVSLLLEFYKKILSQGRRWREATPKGV